MNKRILSFRFGPGILVLVFTALIALAHAPVHGQDRAIMQRMQERLPEIDRLLQESLVGEGNRGILEARAELSEEQARLVAAENQDRIAVYRAIANRAGQSIEEVARQRALQIRTRASPGIWLQSPEGEWYRKPE